MIFLIPVLALFLRLIGLNQSLWLDEAINVVYAQSSDFWWFVTKYPIGDFHPPGWFAILWIWGQLFGFSEIAVRLPSVILGVTTVWLIYLLGRQLFNKKVALFASLLLAIAPLHIYYSQEARMYVFAAFATSASFYFLNRLILKKSWAGLGYITSLVLVIYSDYLAYLVIPAQFIYLIWVKKLHKDILVNFLISGLAFIPWLGIFPAQLQTGINTASNLPGWAQVVGSSFKDLFLIPVKTFFGRITFSDKIFYVIISGFAGGVFGGLFVYGLKKIDSAAKLLISWIFIPLILAFLISFFVPVLAYFRMIFILPAFYLILGKSLESLSRKISLSIFIIICLISFSSLMAYYLNPKFQREDWKGAMKFVSDNLDNQTAVIFENSEIPAPVRYYRYNLSGFEPGLSDDLVSNLSDKGRVFLFEYLVDVYDPERTIEQKLKEINFTQTKIYDFQGVGFVRVYTRL